MSPETVKINSFRDVALRLIERRFEKSVDTVSFDVFDTLLFRTIYPYEHVMKRAAGHLAVLLQKAGIQPPWNLSDLRNESYLSMSEQARLAGFDAECSIYEIYSEWVRLAAGCRGLNADLEKLARDGAEMEISLEELAVIPNREIIPALIELKNHGYRLVFISDMYLGLDAVKRLLAACGLLGYFDKGYVSGDLHLLKREGRLFKHALECENREAHNWLHIGDNPTADGEIPGSMGIQTWLVEDIDNRRRIKKLEKLSKLSDIRRSSSGLLLEETAEQRNSGIMSSEELLGFKIFGPIFSSFIHSVAEKCHEHNIRRVYFLAREGFVFKRLFECVQAAVWQNPADAPQLHYLCVSRLTAFIANSGRFNTDELKAIKDNAPELSIKGIFKPYAIPDEILQRAALKVGVSDINRKIPADFLSYKPLLELFKDEELIAFTEKKSALMQESLGRYLEQCDFFRGGRVAIVDVGWNGRIQNFIFNAFRNKAGFPDIHGYYLGLKHPEYALSEAGNSFFNLMADVTHNYWMANAAFIGTIALEMVLRAPHGTVIDYIFDSNGNSIPVFKGDDNFSRKAEKQDEETISLIQSGIFNYCRHYASTACLYNLNAVDTLPHALRLLGRIFRFPRADEAGIILAMNNVSDLGSDMYRPLGASTTKKRLPEKLSMLLSREYRDSLWQHGSIAQTEIPLSRWIYAALKAYRDPPNQNLEPGSTKGHVPQYAGQSASYEKLTVSAMEEQLEKELNSIFEQLVSDARRKYSTRQQAVDEHRSITGGELLGMELSRLTANLLLRLRGFKGYENDLPAAGELLDLLSFRLHENLFR